ncbi:VOC family protein [Castellaniella sp. S9]|uniref:VOC family protein n=1 Tax=Castellaniella sp. S9 TaxID=2993652 RepID=UPI0022B4FFCA|nr:VOC family protein [Castellaniella sp. S9]
MKPRITVITIGVEDLDASLRFYRDGLGFPTEMTLGHNVSSKAEVDEVMATAASAGATIVKPAHDTFWGGYSGYFLDPDRHLWEIVWNPQWCEEAGE